MFERYTEKARRVIFFARYEASQFGSHSIEPEHLLLGLLREDKELFTKFLPDPSSTIAAMRKKIESDLAVMSEKVSASVDLPLSQSAKRVLNLAAAQSEKMQHRHIGTEHLLFALIEEGQSLASRVLSDYMQLNSAAKLLEREEVMSQEEFAAELVSRQIAPRIPVVVSLLDLLARKGVITEDERRELLGRGGATDGSAHKDQ